MHQIKSALLWLFLFAGTMAQAIEWKVNGFGSLYYGQATTKDLLPNSFTDTAPDFTDFSLIGTDVFAKFSEDWGAAAELIAEGQSGAQSNYILFAQWAYVNWTPWDGFSFKLGRQRYPIWTASEYINNHSELPYRAMPYSVYGLSPFAAFDGISATQSFKLSDNLKTSVQLFTGTPLLGLNTDKSVANFKGSHLYGGRINLEGDGWRVRIQASKATEDIDWGATYAPGFGAHNTAAPTTLSAGYRLDKYNFVSWGEYGQINSSGSLPSPLPTGGGTFLKSGNAGYVLVGYHIDKFTPRYTFARTVLNEGIQAGGLSTHTVGVNYQASANVIVKAEYEMDTVDKAGDVGFNVTQPRNALGTLTTSNTSGNAVYVGADFTF